MGCAPLPPAASPDLRPSFTLAPSPPSDGCRRGTSQCGHGRQIPWHPKFHTFQCLACGMNVPSSSVAYKLMANVLFLPPATCASHPADGKTFSSCPPSDLAHYRYECAKLIKGPSVDGITCISYPTPLRPAPHLPASITSQALLLHTEQVYSPTLAPRPEASCSVAIRMSLA